MPKRKKAIERMLIIGGSGYLGRALYREFQSFYEVFGTFCHADEFWENHGAFYHYNSSQSRLSPLLQEVRPSHVIVNMWSEPQEGLAAMNELVQYALIHGTQIILLSHVLVFDAVDQHPSYPTHRRQSVSKTGKYFIELEKCLEKLPKQQWLIARVAMVIGINSPVVQGIKMKLAQNEPIEVFPNLIVSAVTRDMLVKQLHYLINQKTCGIVHCASTDLIHHIDLITEISSLLGRERPRLTHVYNSNKETYLALMSDPSFWPNHLQISIQEVIKQGALSHIETAKSVLNT